jgi:hypothetical protein
MAPNGVSTSAITRRAGINWRTATRRVAGRRRWTTRVSPDLRLDTNDYSLDPALVGRRIEVTADQRTVTAACLDTVRGCLPTRARLRAAPDDHCARARAR